MLNLFQSFTSLIKSSGAGDKVFGLLDRRPLPPATGSSAVRAEERDVAPSHDAVSIKLENVHFAYPTRPNHPVLNGLDLKICEGQTMALVGSSGKNESTSRVVNC